MSKKLEIITRIFHQGNEIGELSVEYRKEHKNFEIKLTSFSGERNSAIKLEKKMEVSLREYDKILNNFTNNNFQVSHEIFKGHLGACKYKSRYAPIPQKYHHNS